MGCLLVRKELDCCQLLGLLCMAAIPEGKNMTVCQTDVCKFMRWFLAQLRNNYFEGFDVACREDAI